MKKYIKNFLFLMLILYLLIGIIKYPQISLDSAYKGLSTWFNVVIPSLFPFFIVSEILISIGFVKFIGKALQRIMKPLFNVRGEGAFPFCMSIISGYPMGAKIVSDLREKNLISKTEAERAICFSSTSGPLFMLGAVSIGILKNSSIAPLIIYPHYLGAITVGIIMRFYKKKENIISKRNTHKTNTLNLIKTNLGRDLSIGSILSNSVKNSINTILLIGGFIVFYSVLTELLFVSNFFNSLIGLLNNMLPINVNKELLHGFIAGLLEITTGCQKISTVNINLIYKILIINFLIGWSGFSIHSQALSFISKTDINNKIYFFSKFIHGIFSSLYGFILYTIKYKNLVKPSIAPELHIPYHLYSTEWTLLFMSSLKLVVFTTIYMLICSLIMLIIYEISSDN